MKSDLTMHLYILALWIAASPLLVLVEGHGRLIEPPSRATMWRYGFNSPPNYNDHELYCGGFSRQWNRNGGKCGICGDAWDMPNPRPHEAGGKYGQGIIVRRYKRDSHITLRVELTANHRGHFEFRICPNNNPKKVATQQCLDKYVLYMVRLNKTDQQSYEYKYFPDDNSNKVFEIRYALPKGLTCTQCILQWKYIAGNNWGTCSNGTGAVGCGPQEEFRACADIAIVDGQGIADETPFEDEDVNEIPTHEDSKTPFIRKEEQSGTQWWLILIIVVGALIMACSVFALVYLYYYHASDTVKMWMGGKSISPFLHKQPPIPPPRTKTKMPAMINHI